MTMFNSFSSIAMVLLIISMASSLVTSRNIAFSPSDAPALSPAQLGRDEYLESCAAKLTEKCGAEVFSYIFENNDSYSFDCCTKLLYVGQDCHNAMTDYSASLPQFRDMAEEYYERSDRVWDTCALGDAQAPSPSSSLAAVLLAEAGDESNHDEDASFSPSGAPSPALTGPITIDDGYLDSCARALTEKCGVQLNSFIFENGKTFSEECCDKLASTGKECFDAVMEYSVGLPQYKPDAAKYIARSEEVYSTCGFSPFAPSPKLSPTEKILNEYLESCADSLTEKCGEEVFSYVFENGTTRSAECCAKLRSTGKGCHDAMTEYSVELPQYKANASAIISRSDEIWNKCSIA